MTPKSIARRAWAAMMLAVALVLAGCATMSLQDEIDALMKEGQQLYSVQKYDEAIGKFGQVINKDPKQWLAYVWIARAFIAQGKWFDAVGNAKKAYDLSPGGADVLKVFGEALFGGGADALKNGRFADSVRYFVDFLKLEPGNASAWLNVAKAYLGQGQFREAFNALIQGLASGGGAQRQELIRQLLDGGIQAFSRGNYRDAIDMLKEYVKFDSNNLSAYLNLAKSYWEAGERGNALDMFRKVLQLNPRQEEALRFLLQGR
jgi:tetratricopeptide (TPR) repeat protein